MFAKLLKYEWKATAKLQGILALAALGAGLLGSLVLRLLINTADQDNVALMVFGAMSMVLIIVSLIAYAVASFVLLLVRFYKNKFTDEGYLTFTLPANCHQILGSSAVNVLLWELISAVVLIAAIALIILLGLQGVISAEEFNVFWSEFRYLWSGLGYDGGYMALSIVNVLVSAVSGTMIALTAITVGAVVAKKHKILAAFGIYYGVNAVVSMLTSVVTITVTAAEVISGGMLSIWFGPIFQLVLSLVLAIGGYLLSTYLMHRKLNLP